MAAEDVLGALDALAAAGIAGFVDGGWGVDALVGEQTRAHDDLDLQVSLDDVARARRVLATFGYLEELPDGRPANFVLRRPDDRRVDVHAVRLDDAGGGLYELEDGTTWRWPPGSFEGAGRIGGRVVTCLSAEAQVLGHAGYELGETDRHDLALLRERLGVGDAAAHSRHDDDTKR